MDLNMDGGAPKTLRVRKEHDIGFIQIHRPESNNTISDELVEEMSGVLRDCERDCKIVVLEGLPQVFCFGADFKSLELRAACRNPDGEADRLYGLWSHLSSGSFVSIAHVRGKVNAGGVGFVSACDIVLSEEAATFSLSELLFGVLPACVLPFLVRRVGFGKANVLTLTTQPISARQALDWGLVDAVEESSDTLLRKHLLRMRRLSKPAIARYKRYRDGLDDALAKSRPKAVQANAEAFSDPQNLESINRYVKTGKFPWEA